MADQDQFSAGEQALGYLYQIRFALLRMLKLPEETVCFLEKEDDLEFANPQEGRALASLKHKAEGDRLTDMSTDFWKSVRIWLTRYKQREPEDVLSFFLVTTATVGTDFLKNFIPDAKRSEVLVKDVEAVLTGSQSKTISPIRSLFNELNDKDKEDFLSRITIFDQRTRIEDIPSKIKGTMRTVRPPFRDSVFERLEGWWVNLAIDLMSGKRSQPVCVAEISEKLASVAEQFRHDNLPIDFRGKEPPEGVNPLADERMFVRQLKALDLKTDRIRRAILDYYRAFEQRASWARENVTLSGEVEDYEDRLVEEWDRYRGVICEDIDDESTDDALISAGRELLKWVETHDGLRIRASVSEPYVMIGSYHMLANEARPSVYWHPRFLERLEAILVK